MIAGLLPSALQHNSDEDLILSHELPNTDISVFEKVSCAHQGKVRDTYVVGDKLVIVTTDRQSAFDRLLASIPFKVFLFSLMLGLISVSALQNSVMG